MKPIHIINEGIYRKVFCPKVKENVELFFDCLNCDYFHSVCSSEDVIYCSYPE